MSRLSRIFWVGTTVVTIVIALNYDVSSAMLTLVVILVLYAAIKSWLLNQKIRRFLGPRASIRIDQHIISFTCLQMQTGDGHTYYHASNHIGLGLEFRATTDIKHMEDLVSQLHLQPPTQPAQLSFLGQVIDLQMTVEPIIIETNDLAQSNQPASHYAGLFQMTAQQKVLQGIIDIVLIDHRQNQRRPKIAHRKLHWPQVMPQTATT